MGCALCSYATSSSYACSPCGDEVLAQILHFISGSKSAQSIFVPKGERLTRTRLCSG